MKKIVFLLFITVVTVSLMTDNKELIIPKEAIRFRVIASSNDVEDQRVKLKVKDSISSYLNEILSDVKTYEEANNSIESSLSVINSNIKSLNVGYKMNYGYNYFPEKEYKGVVFPEGYYKSLVIELGEGKGENFWCVMFPPLCLIDEDGLTEKNYQSYFLNLLKKIS